MTECDEILERMPDVAAGRSAWSASEARHVGACSACGASWRVVVAAQRLDATLEIDHDSIAAAVLARIGKPEVVRRPAARELMLRRALIIGLAASVAVAIVGAPSSEPAPAAVAHVPTRIFPELAPLTEPQLETLLDQVATDEDTLVDGGAALPRIGDLTDDQLEQLLRTVEGE